MICGAFFTAVNANSPDTCDKTDKPKSDNSYFLDIASLQPSYNSNGFITHYIEKENHSAAWVFLPIKSSMRDYYKTVANVVATEFHKRIDEHSLVPHTKFLIEKNMDNSGYQLLGSVYKKISFTTPILEIMEKIGDHTNAIYKDHNVEDNVVMWNYLGLPIAPDPAVLELSENNQLIRYDYYNSFQYHRSVIPKKCFCNSYSQISDYNCDVEYMKTFEQELHSKHKETLEKVISEIRIDSKKYLEEKDLREVNQALNHIMNLKF